MFVLHYLFTKARLFLCVLCPFGYQINTFQNNNYYSKSIVITEYFSFLFQYYFYSESTVHFHISYCLNNLLYAD